MKLGDKVGSTLTRAATAIANQGTRRASQIATHLPVAIHTPNPGTRGYSSLPEPPKDDFPTMHFGSANKAGETANALVPYEHDLAELAKSLPTLVNQYPDKNGNLEKGNADAPSLTKTDYWDGLTNGTIPFEKPRKYGIDSLGQIYISGVKANGKQSGHIDHMARIDAKAQAGDGKEPRMVMAGMVTAHREEDGRIVLKVGNQSGHTMPELKKEQDVFAQAAFAQSFRAAEAVTQRFHGYAADDLSSKYRQVSMGGKSISELTAQVEQVAKEHANGVRIVAAAPVDSKK